MSLLRKVIYKMKFIKKKASEDMARSRSGPLPGPAYGRKDVMPMRPVNLLTARMHKAKTLYGYGVVVLLLCMGTIDVYAAGDPLTVVDNLSDFIFALIRAIGLILLGFGIVQVGLSLKSHDPSQRANGFLTVAGGIVITFAKEILNLIVG